jgi:hypothetical protein
MIFWLFLSILYYSKDTHLLTIEIMCQILYTTFFVHLRETEKTCIALVNTRWLFCNFCTSNSQSAIDDAFIQLFIHICVICVYIFRGMQSEIPQVAHSQIINYEHRKSLLWLMRHNKSSSFTRMRNDYKEWAFNFYLLESNYVLHAKDYNSCDDFKWKSLRGDYWAMCVFYFKRWIKDLIFCFHSHSRCVEMTRWRMSEWEEEREKDVS